MLRGQVASVTSAFFAPDHLAGVVVWQMHEGTIAALRDAVVKLHDLIRRTEPPQRHQAGIFRNEVTIDELIGCLQVFVVTVKSLTVALICAVRFCGCEANGCG
jgi:hypothetical protein